MILNPGEKTFMHINHKTHKSETYTLHDNYLMIEYQNGKVDNKN